MKCKEFEYPNVESISFGNQSFFYEPNDPRIREVIDQWGDKNTIIGESQEVDLSCYDQKLNHFYIVIRERDNAIMGLHKLAIKDGN